jgi:hypothetical protein
VHAAGAPARYELFEVETLICTRSGPFAVRSMRNVTVLVRDAQHSGS